MYLRCLQHHSSSPQMPGPLNGPLYFQPLNRRFESQSFILSDLKAPTDVLHGLKTPQPLP